MYLQSLIGLVFKFSIIHRMIKLAAGGLLGLAVLGWVVEHCEPRDNEVVVHVMEPDVDVTIGNQTFQIEGRRFDPIVCYLSPGWHPLVMRRRDRILFEESFEVPRGENVVRTAWDPERLREDQLSLGQQRGQGQKRHARH
jgi:hypothetical protein